MAILPYDVANLNIEFTYKQKMGKYAEFPNICFVDTLDNTAALSWDRMGKDQGIQSSLFGVVSHKNAQRIKKQNAQKISVVIGNPPYNANQANFNDFNKNREYPFIDERIKKTFVKESTAQKTKVYDMYSRFYRWAMDRLDGNGVIAFITNRSFIDSRTFDGFRKCIQRDFDYCYVIDTRSDVRANPKIAGTTHNVFGIQTGVAIMFLVKKVKKDAPQTWEQCRIYYNGEMEDDWRKERKLEWIKNKSFADIRFENIIPKGNNWINLSDNDWEELVPLASKEVKAGKEVSAVFELFSLGAVTNRDDWMYDFDSIGLTNKIEFFHACYESDREKVGGLKNVTEISKLLNQEIKWTEELERHALSNHKLEYNKNRFRLSQYRPFTKKFTYFGPLITHRPYQNESVWGVDQHYKNLVICITNHPQIDLLFFCSSVLIDQGFGSRATSLISLYRYDPSGNRHDNITDWGLERFRRQYAGVKQPITKEDIFHYTYAVLHDPKYREKYALNLKRDFPRLPFYYDFFQWVDWGKQLMDLHIGYETVAPYPLERTDLPGFQNLEGLEKPPKTKLKADKEAGSILLDEATTLRGIPPEAWAYKLGNRSALEWVLDQYKEKKPKDKTIAEKFNTYRFADYKEHVIDLLKRVCTVSVETMKVVREMGTKQ